MATISKKALDAYNGYDAQDVGIGLSNPNIYKTPDYEKKKIQTLAFGLVSESIYSGFDHDSSPLIVPFAHEAAYNTILAYNLHYCPQKYRQAIMKYILDSNAARIKANQPILVDYHAIKRAVPISQFIVRRYKQTGLRVVQTYPLNEIPNIITEPSRWEQHYKLQKTS